MTPDDYGQAYQSGGFRLTVGLLHSRGRSGDAEDLAQEAWMRGWMYLGQLRQEANLSAWVNRIAQNLHWYNHRLYRLEREYRKDLPQPVTNMDAELAAMDVRRLLTFCRPYDRRLLERQLQGDDSEEMGQTAGITRSGMRARLSRIRKHIRGTTEKRRRR